MNTSKNNYRILRKESLCTRVLVWWARLHQEQVLLDHIDWLGDKRPLPTGARAELRRGHTVDDVLLTEGFRTLWFSLGDEQAQSSHDMAAWATVAAVLADVRIQGDEPFAKALGSQKEATGKPYVSELRFAQLQKSTDADEFLRRCRRAVALLGRKADVVSLADSILHWHWEKRGNHPERPDQQLAVRWASDYFTALASYQK